MGYSGVADNTPPTASIWGHIVFELRLIDPNGYTVPDGIRIADYGYQIPGIKTQLLTEDAPRHAAMTGVGYDPRAYQVKESPAPLRAATVDDIVKRLTDTQYDWTAVDALGWGMGRAQLNIAEAVQEAEEEGRIVSEVHRGKKFVQIAPTYTLAYDTKQGCQERTKLRARQVETIGRVVASLADRGKAWDIAVLDKNGQDVTDEFACFQG